VVPPTRESYAAIRESGFAAVAREPLSTFSIDVDTASYSNVRRFLQSGQRPPKDAVRIEELLNYFAYDDRPPVGDDPFSVTAEVASCPWNAAHRLMRVGLRGRSMPESKRPPANLVFLLDVSGSMADANKLPLVRDAFRMLAGHLTARDTVAIVTYSEGTRVVLPPTRGSETRTIRKAIDALEAEGRTNGEAGLQLAYAVALGNFREDGINRVILATDGDFNLGVVDDKALDEMIGKKARAGVFLTAIGVGMGNLQDARIERLADKGNGHYAYVDDLDEARKVFGRQLTATLVPIAKDVKVQVEFNPAKVAGYRLIGYENRALAPQDFHDDTKDAGEIGAGHAVTALYEIVPAGRPLPGDDRPVDPLKYRSEAPSAAATSDELATVTLAYKAPDAAKSRTLAVPVRDVPGNITTASADLRFAAAVAAFGMLLRESEHKGTATWDQVLAMAKGAIGADRDGSRTEFVRLARQAMAM
jgi:Ca-activated chloride channel family protein